MFPHVGLIGASGPCARPTRKARKCEIMCESSSFNSHVQPVLVALVISKIKAGTSLKPLVVLGKVSWLTTKL